MAQNNIPAATEEALRVLGVRTHTKWAIEHDRFNQPWGRLPVSEAFSSVVCWAISRCTAALVAAFSKLCNFDAIVLAEDTLGIVLQDETVFDICWLARGNLQDDSDYTTVTDQIFQARSDILWDTALRFIPIRLVQAESTSLKKQRDRSKTTASGVAIGVICPISLQIPQEPVKLEKEDPETYEKSCLENKKNSSKYGEGPIINVFSDVLTWIERHPHHPDAHLWMQKRLLDLCSPRQFGNIMMHLLRKVDPVIRGNRLEYGDDVCTPIVSDLCTRLEFESKDTYLEGDVNNLANLPGVVECQVCHDQRGVQFGKILAVRVVDLDLENTTKVNSIKQHWQDTSLRSLPLTIFVQSRTESLQMNVSSSDRQDAIDWWVKHQIEVLELFALHWTLSLR